MATNTIKLKKSSVAGKVPTDSDLEYGEVALNFADGRLYYKTSTNQIDFFRSDSALGGAGRLDSAQANDLIDAKIQVLDIADIVGSTGNVGEYLRSLGNGNAEWASIAGSLGGVDSATAISLAQQYSLDSAETLALIDSAYINARVSAGTDSSTVISLVQSTVDSAYVQARQDFAYSSLTGAPNVLDSANVSAIIGATDTFDSAGIISLIDSAHVQARQTPQDFAYSSLTGAPNVLDSADVQFIVDSTYIQSKQLTYDFLDSSEVLLLVDSAYVQARQITYDVQATIDSSYGSVATDFLPRLDSTYDLGSPTKKWKDLYLSGSSIYLGNWVLKEGANGMLVVDSTGTQYEIPVVGDNVSSFANDANYLDSVTAQNLITVTYIRNAQDYAYSSLTGAPNVLDSADVTGLIDSTYIQSKQLTYDFLDSSEVLLLVDSSYVQARQITYNVLDSANVKNIFSGGTGVTYNNSTGEISIGQEVDSSADLVLAGLTTTGNVIIGGTLQVTGTTTTVDTQNLKVTDNMIYLNGGESAGSPTASIDIGFAGNYNDDGAYRHTGFFRDATDNTYKVFDNYLPEPDASLQIDTNDSTFALAPFAAKTLAGKYLGFDSDKTAAGLATQTYVDNAVEALPDSAQVLGLIDSAHIQARQITYTNVSEFTNDANYLDSSTVTGVINAAYIQANQTTYDFLDSAETIALIDSAYVQARQLTYDFLDSAETISLIDSAYVQARQITYTVLDSADVTGLIDSAYINARVTASGGTDSATVITLVQANSLDSAEAIALIDSAYVQARQAIGGSGVGVLAFRTIDVTGQTSVTADDSADTLTLTAGDKITLTTSGDDVITFTVNAIDSAEAISLIDSAYIQARQLTYDFLDSAEAISLIDSAYIQSRQDFAYSSLTGTPTTFDSSSNAVFATVTTTGNLVVGGNLQVDGTTTTVDTQNLKVTDNMIYLNAGESSGSPTASIDIGFAGNYNDDGSYAHTGFFRDATDNTYKLFDGYLPEPDASTQINTSDSTFSLAPLSVGAFTATTITGAYQGFDSDFTSKSTTDLSEGTNKYYTKARVDSDITALVDSAYIQARQITYDFLDSAEVISLIDSAYINARVTAAAGTDSATVITLVQANSVDSSEVIGLIDSAYVQARQDFAYSALSGRPDVLDSANIIAFIDSAYIQTRQLTYDFLDSAEAIALIDSAYINSRVTPNIDSALVTGLIDSAYVADRRWGTYLFDSDTTYVVTVASKTPTHAYYGVGSSDAYFIDGKEAPFIELVPGQTYTFDQSDATNSSHPLRFYYDADKTTAFTSGVTVTGTEGNAGAKVEIVVDDDTPSRLYYQCSNHSYMGWAVAAQTHNLTGLTTDDLTEGSTNQYFTTARARSAFSQGTGVTISSGQISIGQTVGTTDNVTFNNLILNGNLTVNGTTTTVDTETIALADNIIELNSNIGGSNPPSQNAGIEINRGSENAVQLRWNETTDAWEAATLDSDGGTPAYYRLLTTLDSNFSASTLGGESGGYYLNFNNLANRPTSILDLGILDGNSGQALITDGSGNFSFSTITGGSGGGVAGQTQVTRFDADATGSAAFTTAAGTYSTVQVYVNGILAKDSDDYSFNDSSGIVTFTTAPETNSEVSIYGYKTSTLTVDSSGNASITGDIAFGNHGNMSSATRTLNVQAESFVDAFDMATVRGAKYVITVENDSDRYQISEILLIQDGLTASVTTYGTINKGGGGNLATFDADIDSGNSLVRLLATPTTVNTTYKVVRTDMLI